MPTKYWQEPGTVDSSRGWPRVISSLALSGIGLFFVFVGIVSLVTYGASDRNVLGIILLIAGIFLVLATLRGLAASLDFLTARWKLGRVDVRLMPEELRCRDDLYVSVEFRPPAPVHLNQATAFLEAFEVADYLTKKKRATETRQIHEGGVTLAVDRALLAQESALLSGKITVPADGPPTFLGGDQKILWFVSVRLDFRGGARWSTDIPILLQP